MKTITIGDLRHRRPKAEKALQFENGIIITRYGKPVAKLVRLAADRRKRKRWDPDAHMSLAQEDVGQQSIRKRRRRHRP